MTKSNLAVLLAQRGLKITKLSEATRISRTTLTALYYNKCLGVQFDTMDTLCNYLGVTPGDLFLFTPIELIVSDCRLDDDGSFNGMLFAELKDRRGKVKIPMRFECPPLVCQNKGRNEMTVFVDLLGKEDPLVEDNTNERLLSAMEQVPFVFAEDFQRQITDVITHKLMATFPEKFDIERCGSNVCNLLFELPQDFRRWVS